MLSKVNKATCLNGDLLVSIARLIAIVEESVKALGLISPVQELMLKVFHESAATVIGTPGVGGEGIGRFAHINGKIYVSADYLEILSKNFEQDTGKANRALTAELEGFQDQVQAEAMEHLKHALSKLTEIKEKEKKDGD